MGSSARQSVASREVLSLRTDGFGPPTTNLNLGQDTRRILPFLKIYAWFVASAATSPSLPSLRRMRKARQRLANGKARPSARQRDAEGGANEGKDQGKARQARQGKARQGKARRGTEDCTCLAQHAAALGKARRSLLETDTPPPAGRSAAGREERTCLPECLSLSASAGDHKETQPEVAGRKACRCQVCPSLRCSGVVI